LIGSCLPGRGCQGGGSPAGTADRRGMQWQAGP
jgi:hypothetical protein